MGLSILSLHAKALATNPTDEEIRQNWETFLINAEYKKLYEYVAALAKQDIPLGKYYEAFARIQGYGSKKQWMSPATAIDKLRQKDQLPDFYKETYTFRDGSICEDCILLSSTDGFDIFTKSSPKIYYPYLTKPTNQVLSKQTKVEYALYVRDVVMTSGEVKKELTQIYTDDYQFIFVDKTGSKITLPVSDIAYVKSSKSGKIVLINPSVKPQITTASPERKETNQISVSTGTAFSISQSGYYLTNYHVVQNAYSIQLLYKQEKFKATLIAKDIVNDIALIQSDLLLPSLSFSDIPTQKGSNVFTMGFPLSSIEGEEIKAHFGAVNSLSGIGGDVTLFQVDIPIHAGNSGSPLLNDCGEIIGVITSKLNAVKTFSTTGDLPNSVGYAIKSYYIKPLVSDYISIKTSSCKLPMSKIDLVKKVSDSIVIVQSSQSL
jgi:S1-C subfamily serine protease